MEAEWVTALWQVGGAGLVWTAFCLWLGRRLLGKGGIVTKAVDRYLNHLIEVGEKKVEAEEKQMRVLATHVVDNKTAWLNACDVGEALLAKLGANDKGTAAIQQIRAAFKATEGDDAAAREALAKLLKLLEPNPSP